LTQAGSKAQRETPLPLMEEPVVESFKEPEEALHVVELLRLFWRERKTWERQHSEGWLPACWSQC